MFGKFAPPSLRLHSTGLIGQIIDRLDAELAQLRAYNDPRGIYARMPMDLDIR